MQGITQVMDWRFSNCANTNEEEASARSKLAKENRRIGMMNWRARILKCLDRDS